MMQPSPVFPSKQEDEDDQPISMLPPRTGIYELDELELETMVDDVLMERGFEALVSPLQSRVSNNA